MTRSSIIHAIHTVNDRLSIIARFPHCYICISRGLSRNSHSGSNSCRVGDACSDNCVSQLNSKPDDTVNNRKCLSWCDKFPHCFNCIELICFSCLKTSLYQYLANDKVFYIILFILIYYFVRHQILGHKFNVIIKIIILKYILKVELSKLVQCGSIC